MKNIFKFYLLTFVLLSDFVVFAQPGDNSDNGGGLEGNGDPQPTPINSKLFILALTGILFVMYTYRKNKKTV